jgi:subtilisin family serine protease
MRKLFAVLLVAVSAAADEYSYRSLQSGFSSGPTPLYDHGLFGQGQIIAVLDTGVEYDSCYFAEPDHAPPPFNTGSPAGGLDWENVDLTRRKIVAYNFLFSCDQYPGRAGCDTPLAPGSTDNHGHGTHTAAVAAGDRGAFLSHDFADSVAPGAKLIVQDAGYTGGDACTQFPGVGCPANLIPIFEQAYRQGARIHSNSWGDRQGNLGAPPTANYPKSAFDVDAFVYTHPDMLIVFNTGNLGSRTETPLSSLSAPGSAKNTLQVGGTRTNVRDDDVLAAFTLFGPTRDGRLKPDVVGPARIVSGGRNLDGDPQTCDTARQDGTSFASPSIASAAALVRQYYTDGFYPTGMANAAHARTPSAALLKATIIAAAREVRRRGDVVVNRIVDALPAPSHQQGWGFPVLDDVLYFPGDPTRMHVIDVPLENGLAAGQSATIRVNVNTGSPFKAVLVWTDPPGHVAGVNDTTPQLVNDLDLRVDTLGGGDHLNNVEVVTVEWPSTSTVSVTVTANRLGFGQRQGYALVLTGDFTLPSSRVRAVRH